MTPLYGEPRFPLLTSTGNLRQIGNNPAAKAQRVDSSSSRAPSAQRGRKPERRAGAQWILKRRGARTRRMPAMTASRAAITLASASFLLIFAGFRQNLWRTAESYLFAANQQDTEALVIGRMVWSRQRGAFASAGLLGLVGTGAGIVASDTSELWGLQRFALQTQAYLEGAPIRSFSPYLSQSGLQGMIFVTLDAVLPRAAPAFKLAFFHTLTAALVAATYSLLLIWLRREFGIGAAFFALLVILASPWLTMFARNLYWSLWLFFLPPLAIGAVLSARSARSNPKRWLGIAAFVTLLARFLSGYEYVTLALAMALAPVLYYSIRDTWSFRALLSRLGILTSATLAALIVSLALLTLQITAVTGSTRKAADHIRSSIGRRTSGDPSEFPPMYAAALSAKTSDVLRVYMLDPFDRRVDPRRPAALRWVLSRNYGALTMWILLAAVWVAARTAWLPADRRFRPLGLAGATLCVLLGTLSWLVIFKAHSFIHVHVNPLMWHLLFLPFGGALLFVAIEDAVLLSGRTLRLLSATRQRRAAPRD